MFAGCASDRVTFVLGGPFCRRQRNAMLRLNSPKGAQWALLWSRLIGPRCHCLWLTRASLQGRSRQRRCGLCPASTSYTSTFARAADIIMMWCTRAACFSESSAMWDWCVSALHWVRTCQHLVLPRESAADLSLHWCSRSLNTQSFRLKMRLLRM